MSIEVGSKLEGKVTGITHFGAFVELPGKVTGLVHISEVADNYVKDVKDFLKIDDIVTVKVVNVDNDGKIGLSIKQAKERPPEEARPAKPARSFDNDRSGRPPMGGGRPPMGGGRPPMGGGRSPMGGGRPPRGASAGKAPSFEDRVSKYLKDSEERLSSLKRNTESKRGGRGARRG